MHVHAIDVPRVLIEPSSDEVIYVGETRKIICTADGFPIPTVQLYEDHELVHSSTLPFLTWKIPTNTARIATYTCIATNYAGNKTRTNELKVTVEVRGRHTIAS